MDGDKRIEPSIQCDYCGEELYKDDEYLDTVDAMICRKCVEKMSIPELMEVCGLNYDRAS